MIDTLQDILSPVPFTEFPQRAHRISKIGLYACLPNFVGALVCQSAQKGANFMTLMSVRFVIKLIISLEELCTAVLANDLAEQNCTSCTP